MLKLSRKTLLALEAVIDIAFNARPEPVQAKEITAREIGRDEYTVIQTLLAVVDAQRDYVSLDPMKFGVPTYARRLLSSPGKKDGLYWQAVPGEPESPTPPITSLPALSGTPPPMAITLGSVVCSRRTGRVAMSLMNSSVVILKVMAV